MYNQHTGITATPLTVLTAVLGALPDSELDARSLLKFIEALGGSCENISGIYNVADHFLESAVGAEELIKVSDFDEFDTIRRTAEQIKQAEPDLQEKLCVAVYEQLRVPAALVTARLSALYTACPLWVMFYHTTEFAHAGYPQLRLQVFLALKRPGVKNWRLAHSSRALRTLGAQKYAPLLDKLPDTILSPGEYVLQLKQVEQLLAMNVALAEGIEAISLLRKAIEGRTVNRQKEEVTSSTKGADGRKDPFSPGYRRKYVELESVVETLPPEIPKREVFSFLPPILDEVMREKLSQEDVDDQQKPDAQTAGEDGVSTGCYSIQQYQRKVRRTLVPAAKATAQVYHAYFVLTPYEVRTLLTDNYLNTNSSGGVLLSSLPVFIALMFFTGRDIPLLIKTTCQSRMPSLKNPIDTPVYVPSKGVLVVPASYDIHCASGGKSIREKALPKACALVLPLPFCIQQMLQAWLPQGRGRRCLFQALIDNKISSVTIDKKIKVHLKNLNARYGARLSKANIQKYLAHQLTYMSSSGFVAAALVTGQFDSANQAPATYASISCQRLQADYQACCQAILQQSGLDNTMPMLDIKDDERFIGSNIVPSKRTLMELIKKLKHGDLLSSVHTAGTIIEVFNRVATYTAMMLSFAIGQRATYEMLPNMTEDSFAASLVQGCIVMNEKDRGDQYHSRLAYLPECVRELGRAYLELRKRALKHLNLVQLSSSMSSTYSLFFLIDDDTVTAFSLPLFAKRFKDAWPFPANALRHALCSYLHQAGCPEIIINAQMGHWSPGREPWHEHSELTVQVFVQTLSEYLDPLMHQLGWHVQKANSRG